MLILAFGSERRASETRLLQPCLHTPLTTAPLDRDDFILTFYLVSVPYTLSPVQDAGEQR